MIVVKSVGGCLDGKCNGGSFDSVFYYEAPNSYGPYAVWHPGSSPSSDTFVYGPSNLGYVPNDHWAGGEHIYPQRPALMFGKVLKYEF